MADPTQDIPALIHNTAEITAQKYTRELNNSAAWVWFTVIVTTFAIGALIGWWVIPQPKDDWVPRPRTSKAPAMVSSPSKGTGVAHMSNESFNKLEGKLRNLSTTITNSFNSAISENREEVAPTEEGGHPFQSVATAHSYKSKLVKTIWLRDDQGRDVMMCAPKDDGGDLTCHLLNTNECKYNDDTCRRVVKKKIEDLNCTEESTEL
tara:strand:+ start:143 stop:763 length:621 start_codon:yes stop_codon:yes gene_type:complete